WANYTDEQLLDLRLCDLGVKIEGTELEDRIARLNGELTERGFVFRPHFWLSHGWFTPDGTAGVAMPFYLAHLRHEVGHALDNVYRLHFRKRYKQLFGSWSVKYPEFYDPKPYSKSYVQHLDMWYAQSHPAEDFAETFAVWLRPSSRWKTRYRDWPALRKLEYVDELMKEIA